MNLYDNRGRRLYFTPEERKIFLETAARAQRQTRSFCSVMHSTGCRISEALQLSPSRINLSDGVIVFRSLKKRRDKAGKRRVIHRAVPVPPDLLDMLDMVHGIREAQRKGLDDRLWPWTRMTAYRNVMAVINDSGIAKGPHSCPKGLRHGFGIAAISKGIALNMLQKWLGHAQLSTTAIYADAVGPEEQNIAARMWT